MWWPSPIVPALGRLRQDDCWVHKLQASLVSIASCQRHSRGGGREESKHGGDEICHSFSCLLLMCRELVSLLSVIDFKSMLKLVYQLAPENFLKENHILASMFSSGPRNKLFKRVDTSPTQSMQALVRWPPLVCIRHFSFMFSLWLSHENLFLKVLLTLSMEKQRRHSFHFNRSFPALTMSSGDG